VGQADELLARYHELEREIQASNPGLSYREVLTIALEQLATSPETLAGLLQGLARERLVEMARKARSLGHPDATARCADAILSTLDRRIRRIHGEAGRPRACRDRREAIDRNPAQALGTLHQTTG
jgi:hypothetical protein